MLKNSRPLDPYHPPIYTTFRDPTCPILRGSLHFIVATCFLTVLFSPVFAQSKDTSKCPGETVDRLGPEKARPPRAFLSELKSAVELDQRSKVANMMRFPLLVATPQKRLEIGSREEFLYNYNHILTPKVKAKIGDEMSSRCLFVNWQGFMVGDGEVWFKEISSGTFRVISIGTEEDFSPRQPPKNTARCLSFEFEKHVWSCSSSLCALDVHVETASHTPVSLGVSLAK
jgi:hypothetical protein